MSRRIFAAPAKSKASNHMEAAFNRIFSQMPSRPRRIFSDKGKEFIAGPLKNMFNSRYITKIEAENPDVKAAVAERFIRTIKGNLKFLQCLN